MLKMQYALILPAVVISLLWSIPAPAQAPAPPPPVYSGSFGGGLALTGGNTDTKNFNLAFAFARDPKTRNVFKVNALSSLSTATRTSHQT